MRAVDGKPNIVFIVLDTHRWDRLGCYGYPKDTSPNLDAFAEGAILFENAIAPAQWTIPSHASMFTGEPASVHRTLQASDVLPLPFTTLAQRLRAMGYHTTGFCNNPLVGVLDNGLRRGFEAFYNYGGAVPSGRSRPSAPLLEMLHPLRTFVTGLLRGMIFPIQNAFANSVELFQGALNPFWVRIWTRVANFKGNTSRSVQDMAHFVEEGFSQHTEPYFLFLNLMETHAPYSVPRRYAQRFAPLALKNREGRRFLRHFNAQALDWFTPLEKPLSPVQGEVLSQMYDAEVAYQDSLLEELLALLDRGERRQDTMVIFVADHGEMLGEHQFMGHGFGVYQELIRVPLLIRLPGQGEGTRVTAPVSTRRLFHTILDTAGVEQIETAYGEPLSIKDESLSRVAETGADDGSVVFSEAYAPEFALKAMETRKPAVIERMHCRSTYRAAIDRMHKLVDIEGVGERFFSLNTDPREEESALTRYVDAEGARSLRARLKSFLQNAMACSPRLQGRQTADTDDAALRQRLRHLGYME
ncbi:MAG: sulfatase [Chloroflexota bacterium]|nr:sulfatase [Chloroflexota bacterium]